MDLEENGMNMNMMECLGRSGNDVGRLEWT